MLACSDYSYTAACLASNDIFREGGAKGVSRLKSTPEAKKKTLKGSWYLLEEHLGEILTYKKLISKKIAITSVCGLNGRNSRFQKLDL